MLSDTVLRRIGGHKVRAVQSERAQTDAMDRDRDSEGRARNARPRDGLGRPLPYGMPGVPRQPEGVVRTAEQTLVEAQQLLDTGQPFHAHEVFEDAWKHSSGTAEAGLWKGLAQLAVAVTHRLRGNQRGADRLFRRAAAALEPYCADPPHGMNLAQLRDWALGTRDQAMPSLLAATVINSVQDQSSTAATNMRDPGGAIA